MAAAFKQAMRACANPVRPPPLVGRSMLREFGPATENGAALLREVSLAPLLPGDTRRFREADVGSSLRARNAPARD